MKVDIGNQKIASFVEVQRMQTGLSLRTFAKEAGISLRSLTSILSGKTVKESTVKKVMDYLGFEIKTESNIWFEKKE